MADVVLEGLRRTFPNGHVALDGVDLAVADGELVVLVGPSGCGKSTTLRLVAGLDSPTAGRIRIGGRDVTGLAPQERDVAMVFQSYALYPHLRVRENLGFGLRMRGVGRAERARRVESTARLLGIETLLDRRPVELSGGQRQRVALGRAIVREPQAFLLDEPLSNLDAKLRARTRTELSRLHRRLRATMLYVTHDQEEAMTLGDRIAVMRDGRLLQVAPPLEVYERPASAFVGELIGSPAMNLVPCRLSRETGRARLEGPGFALSAALRAPAPEVPAGLLLGIRPHDLLLAPAEGADLTARVDVVEALGSSVLLHALLEGRGESAPALRVLAPVEARPKTGDRVGLRLHRERVHLFAAESGERIEDVALA